MTTYVGVVDFCLEIQILFPLPSQFVIQGGQRLIWNETKLVLLHSSAFFYPLMFWMLNITRGDIGTVYCALAFIWNPLF